MREAGSVFTNPCCSYAGLHCTALHCCSYAGLHCVVIKGYSKSAGYQPGVKFEDNRFRNSWNAVYVAGAWRFVQCNWGARSGLRCTAPGCTMPANATHCMVLTLSVLLAGTW